MSKDYTQVRIFLYLGKDSRFGRFKGKVERQKNFALKRFLSAFYLGNVGLLLQKKFDALLYKNENQNHSIRSF